MQQNCTISSYELILNIFEVQFEVVVLTSIAF